MRAQIPPVPTPAEAPADPPASLRSIVYQVEQYLRNQQEDGASSVLVDPREVQALSARPAVARSSRPGAHAASDLAQIARAVAGCCRCSLHKARTQAVPGQGTPHPDILFVGEGPGAEEDEQGLAFVGPAGQLLTKMIEAMGYRREEVFIANVVKCRPPANRTPLPEEIEQCLPYLTEQIAILKPKVIVALGATAVKGLLNPTVGIMKLRGNWMSFEGIPVMPTYHPAYLLRYPSAKKEVWLDLQEVLKRLGREPPPRAKA